MDKKEWLKKFSRILCDKLNEKNISGYKFGLKIGLTSVNFYSYMNGESMPSAYSIGLMAKGLDCTTDELIIFDGMDDYEYIDTKGRKVVEVPRDNQSNMTTTRWKKLFGQNLYNKLVEKNITQVELASRSNIATGCISRYVEGEMIPNAWRLLNIARVLDCTVDDLVNFGSMVIDCR